MKILVINCGSSSIKYQLFDMPGEVVLAKGLIERIGEASSIISYKNAKGGSEYQSPVPTHEEGLNIIVNILTDKEKGVIASADEITGVGHRVVHGGEGFQNSVLISDGVTNRIEEYAELAPLHNPPNLVGIKASQKFLPQAAHIASFDTAFHQSIPAKAYLYALPLELYEKYRIRRYGFHGSSHRYITERLAEISRQKKHELNLISCHLGNGCSVAAVSAGKSVDTSMGFTPLEGLVMGTRCGDIDPAIIFYLMTKGYTQPDLNKILNKKSGLLGISGISNDMRNIIESDEKGNKEAGLAVDIFCYRLRKYIGSYMAVLGNTYAIVFTGGIGENNARVRQETLAGMSSLGIEIDSEANRKASKGFEGKISKEGSKVKIYVIPTNEEVCIARDTYEIASSIH
ncbi:acetate kinase [bacterium]|nr:MAG: acetate kinase [bacterium]